MRYRHHTWQWIINWVGRMTAKHGGIVYDGEKAMDWGQAMCREVYGQDWMNDNEFCEVDHITQSEPAPAILIDVCRRWENGEWPEWATVK